MATPTPPRAPARSPTPAATQPKPKPKPKAPPPNGKNGKPMRPADQATTLKKGAAPVQVPAGPRDCTSSFAKKKSQDEVKKLNIKALSNTNVTAFLLGISYCENYRSVYDKPESYYTVVGSPPPYLPFDTTTFPDPGVNQARGRYQIQRPKWQEKGVDKMGLTDFKSGTQDLIAVQIIRDLGALCLVIDGDTKAAVKKLKGVWTSLPGASQGHSDKNQAKFDEIYTKNGGVLKGSKNGSK